MEKETKRAGKVEIEWLPDKTDRMPIYRQIVHYVGTKISNGDWVVGDRLPSQRQLADLFHVNRSTINEAMDELKAMGLIEGNFGKGTQIINNTWSLLVSAKPPNWQSYIEAGIYKANFPTIQMINKLEFMEGITRLSTGELSPDLFPHDMMRKVFQRIPERTRSLNYLGPLGLPELRKVLSQYLRKHNIHVSPSCILIVSGSLQALQLISIGILHPRSTVFVEVPSYLKSLHVFESSGMRLEGVQMDDYGLMPWMLNKNRIKDDTALLYTIPTFHNPTGTVMTKARRKEVFEWCRKNRLPIIEDDAYRELWIDRQPPEPLKSMDHNGMVLYMGTISKSLAPGLRIGWLAGPESVMERLGDIKMQTDYGASSVSQWALAEWIESGLYEEHLQVLRGHLKERRNMVLSVLDSCYKGIASWNHPEGGFYIWLKLNKNISTDKLFQLALEEKLLINPGNVYDFSKNKNIRISYAYAESRALENGLRKLSELIRKLY